MKQRRFHPLFAFAVVSALLLGACSSGGGDKADTTTTTAAEGGETTTTDQGGEDGAEDDDTTTTPDEGDEVEVSGSGRGYVDAMTDAMTADEDMPLSDDQARCFSSRFVDTVGVDRLQAAGITPEMLSDDDSTMEFTELDLSEAEGNRIYDNFSRCGVNLREMMLESMASDDDLTPAMRSCMEGVLTDDNLRTLMVMTMIRGSEALEDDVAGSELMSGLMGCAFMGLDVSDMEIETGGLGEG